MRSVLPVLSVFSSLLPIVFFFVFFKRNRQNKLWVIVLYIVFSIFTDLLSEFLWRQNKDSDHLLYLISTVFTFTEGTIFGYFLYQFLHTVSNRKLAIGLYLLEIFIGVYTFVAFTGEKHNDVFLVSEELAIIVLCTLYFYEQVNNPKVTFLYESKQFWVIIAFFFYTASTLFLFLSESILPTEQRDQIWLISQIGNIIKNLLFVIAFVKSPRGSTLGKPGRKA